MSDRFAEEMRSDKVRERYAEIIADAAPHRSPEEIASAVDRLIEGIIAIWEQPEHTARPPHPDTMAGR